MTDSPRATNKPQRGRKGCELMNQVEQTTPRIIGVLEKGMWELKRDRAFEELFVPLEKDALTRLKANIEREGCTESVYTWNKVISG